MGHRISDAERVREHWRRQSLSTVWLRPGDWHHPAVDALAEALADGRDTSAAAERLGTARGVAGVSIGETIDDLLCLYRAVGAETDVLTLRALGTGWAEGAIEPGASDAVRDPASGLVSAEYLRVRLGEAYAHAAALGLAAGTTSSLVHVDVAVGHVALWQRASREAGVGEALRAASAVGPAASIGDGVYAILVPASEAAAIAEAARREIESATERLHLSAVLRRPPRISIITLPATLAEAETLLDDLRR
ncbi:hypothetical protein SAMN04489860_0794 [Paraoerskovia marina]|uniref:GGDEF domain-containing protein, diguanylate cyclase (C-di-GMP synthetase) or its enzymatically inactive variants n=1 Tax=Paraoerskovia marina TaxID=545619 RepID=A0A1H1PFC8_9CELL|nr:hypothetical protein [Paraoerskovia marina]SDS10008.1 hypothetical protein SAMN04489860_0794 [Paraoerskovia marina]